MLAESLDVSPHLVDHEEVWIGAIPVNVKLQRSWFGSRVCEIGKHAPFVCIGFAWFRSMLGDDTIRARLVEIRVWKFRQHYRHERPPSL
jgi:hypothetical protein